MSSKLETFLKQNIARKAVTLTPKALADLKWFAEQAKEGRSVSFSALQSWFSTEYGIQVGSYRLHTIAQEHGITPWWAK